MFVTCFHYQLSIVILTTVEQFGIGETHARLVNCGWLLMMHDLLRTETPTCLLYLIIFVCYEISFDSAHQLQQRSACMSNIMSYIISQHIITQSVIMLKWILHSLVVVAIPILNCNINLTCMLLPKNASVCKPLSLTQFIFPTIR